jgi:hypothetical protein
VSTTKVMMISKIIIMIIVKTFLSALRIVIIAIDIGCRHWGGSAFFSHLNLVNNSTLSVVSIRT